MISIRDTNQFCLNLSAHSNPSYAINRKVYNKYCKEILTWDQSKITSKRIVFNGHCADECKIDMPIFNKYKTKCAISVTISNSEWMLGSGKVYYYKKSFGKWRMVRSSLSRIS